MLILPALLCSTLAAGAGAPDSAVPSVQKKATMPQPAGEPCIVTDDGAWCWFQDPRAVFVDGPPPTTFACWMTSKGKLQIGAFDHTQRSTRIFTLKERWDVDDHNTAAILVLRDRRLMVFYARHNKRGLYCRTSMRPLDVTAWEDEITILDAPRLTYSHPVYLAHEGTYYVFFRGETWKPTFCTSKDGRVWSPPRVLLQESGREGREIRPYIKVVSDGDSTIHFAFTDGHPRNEAHNSLYYMKYARGAFWGGDGRRIAGMEDLPVSHHQTDCVYDATGTGIRSWVWDVAIDAEGQPCIAYTRLPAETDHRYHYARWMEGGWFDTEVAPGGRWFPQTPQSKEEPEPHYSGGMAIAQQDPAVLYLSRQSGDDFVIERWCTADRGRTWTSRPVESARKGLNVRPVVPHGAAGSADLLLWMTGRYVHFSDYHTEIRLSLPPPR